MYIEEMTHESIEIVLYCKEYSSLFPSYLFSGSEGRRKKGLIGSGLEISSREPIAIFY